MQVNPNYTTNLTGSLNASSAVQEQLTNELSSGLRVAHLSDDPIAASTGTQLQSSLSSLDAFVQSAAGNQSLLQVTDSTLGEVVTQVTSAISLATQAGDGTLNASNLSAIQAQVSSIRDNVLSLANTSYLGSYVFSGSQGQTKPFTIDQTTTPAGVSYAGDTVTNSIATPGGQKLALNLPGGPVFSGLLSGLNQLVSDLQSGSTTNAAADAAALTTGLGTVNQQRSTIGSSLQQLASASGYAQTQEAQVQAQQTSLLSADIASVSTNLKSAEVQHQALISVIASLSQTNLFSYLK